MSQYSLQKQYIVEQAYRLMFQVGSMAQPAQWQAGEAFEIELVFGGDLLYHCI